MTALWTTLWTALVAALLLVHAGSVHSGEVEQNYEHVISRSGDSWPWVDLWHKVLYIRRDLKRQEALQDTTPARANSHEHSIFGDGMPVKLELEADEDDVQYQLHHHQESSGSRRSDGPSQRDQILAKAIGPYISPIASNDASAACLESSLAYILNIFNKQWALKMFDSTGKLPDGLLLGNLYAYGNWDECLNTTVVFNASDILGIEPNVTSFVGKYCLTTFAKIGDKNKKPVFMQKPPDEAVGLIPILPSLPIGTQALVGICIPSTCTSKDLENGLNIVLAKLGIYAGVPDIFCYTRDDKTTFSGADVVMITILSLTGLFMLIGTILDIVAAYAVDNSESIWSRINSLLQPAFPSKSTQRRVFLAFSVYTNGRKLLDTSSTGETLGCLHGIRFLSMSWVILGHNYFFASFFQLENVLTVYSYLQSVAFTAISNATVSVDSFFFLSGLLVAYIFMRNIERSKGQVSIIMFYVHRYIRLTPVLLMIMAFDATLYSHLGSGPIQGAMDGASENCRKNWWTNALYVNNLVHEKEMCLGQTWYLANDMQMFIFSPLVLLPLFYWPVAGQLWLIFLVCFFTGINAMVTAVHRIGLPGGDDQSLRYQKPWARAGPYLVGLYMGWFLHKIRGRKIRVPLPAVAIGWLAASLTGCLIIYGMYGQPEVQVKTTNIIYPMLNRTAWSVCLAWVVFACVTGYGGFINTLLSWKAFIPLSRLTYTAYLTSLNVQFFYWYTNKSPPYVDQTYFVYMYLGSLPIIFAVSLPFSLAFESPMMALEKIIFPQAASKPASKPVQPPAEPATMQLDQMKKDPAADATEPAQTSEETALSSPGSGGGQANPGFQGGDEDPGVETANGDARVPVASA